MKPRTFITFANPKYGFITNFKTMLNFLKNILPLLIMAGLFFSSCQDDEKPVEATPPPVTKKYTKVKIPRFDRDSAYQFIEKQVNFGPRVPNTDTHKATKEWLVSKFKEYADNVIEQDFQATAYNDVVLNGTNIIAQFNPDNADRVVLAAHWDTRPIADSPLSTERREEPIAGADDGGSGVGILLEIARQLKANPIGLGIDIVLFDAEDYGAPSDFKPQQNTALTWGLGSQHWSKNLHEANYKPQFGILLDMVGSKNARFTREGVSMYYAPQVMNKVWKLAKGMGYGNYFDMEKTGQITDDHVFVNEYAKIPMIDIINRPIVSQSGFGEYWHTHDDDMDVIDKRTLRAVGQVVLATIYGQNNGDF